MLLSHLRPRHSGLVRLLGPPWPAKEVLGAAQDQNVSAEGAIILQSRRVVQYIRATLIAPTPKSALFGHPSDTQRVCPLETQVYF